MDCANCGAYLIGRDKPATPPVVSPGPGAAWPANPRDRLHPTFTKLWVAWIAEFVAIETTALVIEARQRKAGESDRTKRTLSAFWRYVFATDSVTGIPLDVPYGRARRFAGLVLKSWFDRHSNQEGAV
jgi:hypothetical protein